MLTGLRTDSIVFSMNSVWYFIKLEKKIKRDDNGSWLYLPSGNSKIVKSKSLRKFVLELNLN